MDVLNQKNEIYELADLMDVFQYSSSEIWDSSKAKQKIKTNVHSSSPEIEELRKAIEHHVSRQIKTPADFHFLAEKILEKTKVYISPTTLKRMWNYIDGYKCIRRSSLQILSQFLGYKEWEDFLQYLQNKNARQIPSLLWVSINSDNLVRGMSFELNWDIGHSIVVEYVENHIFQVVKSVQSKFQVGDKIHCTHLVLNRQFKKTARV